MPSFDIVCEINIQEVDNAINQASREIMTRFDFRGGKSSVDLDKANKLIKIVADDMMKLRSIHQMIESKIAKRGLDCRILQYGKEEEGSGQIIRQQISLKSGISKEEAGKITKFIKNTKLKVQAQIQDDQVRITAKKIDDLQSVISGLKQAELGLPLQFVNMRS
ncbi:MAG: YajQ family cyclic di-GMP-binding protein [Deltaproteobacteria bacterium]|nr:YajQ family cyclic di-GMP-binding protein [Deltaproteobacteria bacterium]